MPTAEARIETDRPSRYLVQLCRHAAAMGGTDGHQPRVHLRGMLARRQVQVRAEWSETEGTLRFIPWGTCTITADADTLTLRIDADDEEGLHQLQDVIARDLNRFGRRDQLTVNWSQPETPSAQPGTGPAT